MLKNADEEDWKNSSWKTGVKINSTAFCERPSNHKRRAIDDVKYMVIRCAHWYPTENEVLESVHMGRRTM